MSNSFLTRFGVPLAVAGAILTVAIASPSAQRRRGGGQDQGAPIATNTILESPDDYVGKLVTMSAGVDSVLSQTAFVIDQRKAVSATEVASLGKPILVIAPYLKGTLEQKQYLMMKGQIVKLDPSTLAKLVSEYELDLSPEMGARYAGQPVLVATSVLDSRHNELAKKPIAPPGEGDLAMAATMKVISPTFAVLRTAVQMSQADVVTQNARTLQPAFTQTEMLWDDMGQSPAAQWARDARGYAAAIERDAAAGNWDEVKKSAAALNQTCGSCHAAYRVREDDATFRIMPGSF